MFSHIVLGADDIDQAQQFYDAVLGTLGVKPGVNDGNGRLIYMSDTGPMLMVGKPINGDPACHANGGTVGFAAASAEQAAAWHAAGIAHGGTTCEDPPGIREGGFGKLYLAYMRDPSGNKLCAVHRMA